MRLVRFGIDVVGTLGDVDGAVLLLDTVDAVFDLKTVRNLRVTRGWASKR